MGEPSDCSVCPWEGVGTNAPECAGEAGIWGELVGLSCSQWCQVSFRGYLSCLGFKGAATQCPSLAGCHALGRSIGLLLCLFYGDGGCK